MHLVGLKMTQVLLETFKHIVSAKLCPNNEIWDRIKDSQHILISWWPVFFRPHFNPKRVVWNENEKNCLFSSERFHLRILFNQAVPDLLFSALLVLSLAKDLINERLSSTYQVCSKIILTVQIEKQRAVSLFVAYYLPRNAETQNSAKNSHKRVTVRDDLKFQVGVVSGQSQLS